MLSLLFALMVSSPGITAEIDDSTVFVEAFNAFQQKDYLLVLEKCEQLNQAFPDSPLRDVTLLLIARASLKSGDNERAAKTAVLFSSEFPDSSLKTTVEDELKILAGRHLKGETLAADKTLQAAARKVSTDRLARERAAELKLEMERVAKAKAEQERLARIKLEEERREKERVLAEKRARASIAAAITLPEAAEPVPVGGNASLPFILSNTGKGSEEFVLTVATAKEYGAVLSSAGRPVDSDTRLKLAPGETVKGAVAFRMPPEMVDGHRTVMTIKAVSGKFSDISFQKDVLIISSAPLVRVVSKFSAPTFVPGEKIRFRTTVLNAGSLPARDLTVRIKLPSGIEYIGAPVAPPLRQEADGTLIYKIDHIGVGKLDEIILDVKTRDDSTIGHELRGQVEVINDSLRRKETFTSSASVVRSQK